MSLDTYVVEKVLHLGFPKLSFKDANGNVLFYANGSFLSSTLKDPQGAVLGSISQKLIALAPTYDLHEGDTKSRVIGSVKKALFAMPTQMKIDIQDTSGNTVATANGNFLGMEFNMTDRNGATVAKVTRKLDGGVLSKISGLVMGAYVMKIMGKSVPTQTLVEFLVALELISASGSKSSSR